MATNSYKSGVDRLRKRQITKKQRVIMDNRAGYSYYKKSETNPDTEERIQIHKIIISLVEQGKTKSEIVNILINKFPESELRRFFDSYAQHHIDKKNKLVDEGR